MKIFIERTQKNIEQLFTGVATELLKKLGLTAEEVLIVRNGTLVTEDELLTNDDTIRLLSVVSGG